MTYHKHVRHLHVFYCEDGFAESDLRDHPLNAVPALWEEEAVGMKTSECHLVLFFQSLAWSTWYLV